MCIDWLQRDSKVDYIRDILPDLGGGFVAACLEAFQVSSIDLGERCSAGFTFPWGADPLLLVTLALPQGDAEKVMNSILEGAFPQSVEGLARSLSLRYWQEIDPLTYCNMPPGMPHLPESTCIQLAHFVACLAYLFAFSDWDKLQANSVETGPASPVAARGAAAAPPPPVVATRHNIFDGDEFDVFSTGRVDLSRVHRGKKR